MFTIIISRPILIVLLVGFFQFSSATQLLDTEESSNADANLFKKRSNCSCPSRWDVRFPYFLCGKEIVKRKNISDPNCEPEVRYKCDGPNLFGRYFEDCSTKPANTKCGRAPSCVSNDDCERSKQRRTCLSENEDRKHWDMDHNNGTLCCDLSAESLKS